MAPKKGEKNVNNNLRKKKKKKEKHTLWQFLWRKLHNGTKVYPRFLYRFEC